LDTEILDKRDLDSILCLTNLIVRVSVDPHKPQMEFSVGIGKDLSNERRGDRLAFERAHASGRAQALKPLRPN
jgi:hypothetical protein